MDQDTRRKQSKNGGMFVASIENDIGGKAQMIFSFVGGFAAGSLIAYFVTKKYYRDLADKEVADVTDRFVNRVTKAIVGKPTETVVPIHQEPEKGPQEDPSPDDEPYVIDVEDFANDIDNDKETLIYYVKDEVLTDQWDHVLPAQDILGKIDIAKYVLDPEKVEDDTLYVRNESLSTDYEIYFEHKESPPTALMEGDLDDN